MELGQGIFLFQLYLVTAAQDKIIGKASVVGCGLWSFFYEIIIFLLLCPNFE